MCHTTEKSHQSLPLAFQSSLSTMSSCICSPQCSIYGLKDSIKGSPTPSYFCWPNFCGNGDGLNLSIMWWRKGSLKGLLLLFKHLWLPLPFVCLSMKMVCVLQTKSECSGPYLCCSACFRGGNICSISIPWHHCKHLCVTLCWLWLYSLPLQTPTPPWFKGMVHLKIKFCHLHLLFDIPKPYDFPNSLELKRNPIGSSVYHNWAQDGKVVYAKYNLELRFQWITTQISSFPHPNILYDFTRFRI